MQLRRETFSASMAYLQKIYGKAVQEDVLEIYWENLCVLSEETFLHAVKGIVCEFIPTSQVPIPLVPHFLKYCGESQQSKAKSAVMRLKWAIGSVGRYDSINLGDRVMHGVIDRWGGWPAICSWTDQDWQINQKKFEEDYLAATNANMIGSDHLAGIVEAHNASSGFPVDPPYLVYENDKGQTVKLVCNIKDFPLIKNNLKSS